MSNELDVVLVDPLYEELEKAINEGLDRKLILAKALEEFGKISKSPVLPAVAAHRVE